MATVFGILILCGFGLPVPEDITLVSGGVISGLDLANPHTMCIVGLAGVLIGDSTMFLAGRIFGYRIQRIKTFRRILSPRRFSHIQRKFKQYGLSLLFVARFLPGLRSPIFLVAGMSRRISYLTFILMDGIAALISVPVWVYLGYFFALIYLILGLILLIVLIVYLKKRFHSKLHKFSDEGHSDEAPAASAAATTATTKVATASATPAGTAAATSTDTSATSVAPNSAETSTTAASEQAPVESTPKP